MPPEARQSRRPAMRFSDSLRTTGGKPPLRIVLADDHKLFREALVRLLVEQPDMEVVGQASDGQMAVKMVLLCRPDVVIMDISMPRMNGIEATRIIASSFSGVNVIGLSMYEHEEMANTMRRAGASAMVTKGIAGEALIDLLRHQRPPAAS